ncbi:hypothetical protein HK101_009578 [Irineochytrium annulatum]|nr:hypothetical protein HK101_009578 [Irineochytrium annulatum]
MKKRKKVSILQPERPLAAAIPRHRTQLIIARFHTLNKRLATAEKTGDDCAVVAIRKEMEELGGIHGYQRASLRGGDEHKGKGACGKWLVPHLRAELKRRKELSRVKMMALRLLDVGAVNGETYEGGGLDTWLTVTSIDLNPQHPNVQRQDFFERPKPRNETDRFEVVCLSLVVNFVGEPDRRGQMLRHARDFLVSGGLLYLVLPFPCISNSRYMTRERLTSIMASLGLTEEKAHMTKKLAHFIYRFNGVVAGAPGSFRKEEVNPGPGRNNFSVVLQVGETKTFHSSTQ